VATELVASRVVLSSIEIVSYIIFSIIVQQDFSGHAANRIYLY
jgi:hypothetical protein